MVVDSAGVKNIVFITLYDYNTAYSKGDTLNDIILCDGLLSGEYLIRSLNSLSFNGYSNLDFYLFGEFLQSAQSGPQQLWI